MTAGDTTNGVIPTFTELDAALVAASVTLTGKPGELHFVRKGASIEWLHVVQA